MMKQMLKRTGALLLSLCLTLSVWGVLTPLPAAAETSGDYQYTVNEDNTATITKYLGSGGDVTIPRTLNGHTVTAIGRAFYDCDGLTSVSIPDSVTSIGYDAFTGCTKLTSIHIPDSVTIMGVAFSDTGYYNDPANWKNGVLYIDNHLIEAKADELPAAYSIRPGTKTIGYRAFKDCTGLTSVDIPDSVIEIGDEAFYGCTKLTSASIPDGVTEIGYETFYYCTGLTSVTIPDGVTEIGDATFYYCTGLTSVTLGDGLTYIGEHAFTGCTQLTSVTIPGSVTEIDGFAFAGCTELASVTIEDGVIKIGADAFNGCSSLPSITIPDSVTEIGVYVFGGCTELTSIVVGTNNPNYSSKDGVWFNKDQTELILCPQGKSGSYTIPDSVTTISDAFAWCSRLTSITIPDSVTEIVPWAFEDCIRLTSIDIPDSVTTIGENAFYSCKNLTIYGKVGSYAETYAKENRIPFGTKATNQETGIVVEGTAETLPDDAVLNAKQTASGEDAATYEITLTQNGQPVQPTGEVTVKIPLPESMKDKRITVYRIEANGSRTNMNAKVQNGYVVFITDHFSQYVLEASDALLGDIDGDGKVSVTDALAILRMAVGLSAPVDNADMDGSGSVTVTDALAALRIAVGLA